ncbi:FAD-dependent oxidoreductase [Francisella halioticida]|uniref:FAD-dependent oxidoreductase n=1 Tax=Francisella halioticida TaxID=549298 RepID=A0ABN5B2S3_9GAMM|nr:NAD(P)/FAD-dependent oxidoreductase [Francisella halioticida]ASG68883.1 FAD-dependent oxidoreductase [Francisella halioticida]BCD91872.1 FAD-dependent oxidoreductase [Francisella halioticida]
MIDINLTAKVVIIGAGPSGSVAASLLAQKGYEVIIVEKEQFPRFSIGESLLPQSMTFFKQAGLLDEISKEECFQYKNGAVFSNSFKFTSVDFNEKFANGYSSTYQVKRGVFDKILADKVESSGVKVFYKTQVKDVLQNSKGIQLKVYNLETHKEYFIDAEFILDGSGFGRVLPRLLNLETPSEFPTRHAYFCHIRDNIKREDFDRNKIFIGIHPRQRDIWYWLIPFADGTASVGVVVPNDFFNDNNSTTTNEHVLKDFIQQMPYLDSILENAVFITNAQKITGYSSNVSRLYGDNYALLGNAAEFLDPVFSSGITIAVKSASLAVNVLDKRFRGEEVDWSEEFVKPLYVGINTFKEFVHAWYSGELQKIIFQSNINSSIKRMVISVLAGYAWDENNPFVNDSKRKLKLLSSLCSDI